PEIIHRPHSLVFLGTNSGFWARHSDATQASTLPMSGRGMRLQFLTQMKFMERREREVFRELIQAENDEANLQYWELDLSACTDKEVLVALNFQAPYYPERDSNERTAHILDSACHFSAKQRAGEAGDEPAVTAIPNTQNVFHTGEVGLAGNRLGFVGEGLWVKNSGQLAHRVSHKHPHLQSKPQGFSVEFAMRLLSLPQKNRGELHLLTVPGIVKIGLRKAGRGAKIFATELGSGEAQTIETEQFKPVITAPLDGERLKLGQWYHIGLRFSPAVATNKMVMELLFDGRPADSIQLDRSALRGQRTAVQIDGSCDRCDSTNRYILDEIILSSTGRSLDAFAAGAYETAQSVARRFLKRDQVKTLLAHIGLARFTRGTTDASAQFFLPKALQRYAQPGVGAEARAAVKLGEALFNSPLLSVNQNLEPQTQARSSAPLSCASCHISAQAFTEGKRFAHGVEVGTLNTPTILNRALGRKQFFDQRSDSLIKQVMLPISSPIEMNSKVEWVTRALSRSKRFQRRFERAGLEINRGGIAAALTMFILKQTELLDPQGELDSARARLGQALFFGKARCASCHSGVSLTDERRHDTGVTDEERLIKTPSLVRVAETAPYFHDGSKRNLMDVIDFYDQGFVSQRTGTRRLDIDMRPLGLSRDEKRTLVEYLKAIPKITGN
ncbi:MAG: cytochrome c peroxidase, partial [Myxococcota bacterium]|nr:cytochrome c peroxidase [Myxococcota bacterium]